MQQAFFHFSEKWEKEGGKEEGGGRGEKGEKGGGGERGYNQMIYCWYYGHDSYHLLEGEEKKEKGEKKGRNEGGGGGEGNMSFVTSHNRPLLYIFVLGGGEKKEKKGWGKREKPQNYANTAGFHV